MFDKERCKRCRYSMNVTGGKKNTWVDDGAHGTMCGRSIILHDTCLKLVEGQIVDTRGNDPKHCALYKSRKSQGKRNGRLY